MTRFTSFTLAPAALMATLLADTAMAQTAPDIVGDWHGTVAAPTGDSTLILHVTRGEDEALTGEFENRTVAPGTGAPVADLTVANGRLTFRVWYLARYDPAPNLQRIKVPVLALNGSLDRQTEPGLHLDAWRAGLTNSRDVTIVELPGLNHMFQHARTGGRGEYRDIEETFAPEALALIGDWLRARFVERQAAGD